MSTEQTETIPQPAAVEETLAPEPAAVEEQAVEAEAEPAIEATTEATTEVAAEVTTPEAKDEATQEVLVIEEGYVTKRGPRPLRLWQKRYFRFSDSQQSFPLHRLRYVYRKNVKKAQAPIEEFEKANKLLFETLATASVNASFILAYFKSDDKNEVPQGLINLKQVTAVEPASKIKPFAFIVKTQSRDYVFSTTSQKLTDAWIKTLSDKVTADIPDYTETEGYKYSWGQLVGRKGFTAPTAAVPKDEPFSASEAEFEPEEITKEASAEAAPEEPAQEANPNGTVKSEAQPDAANPRKSFYNEVIDFFYRKNSEDAPQAGDAEAVKEETTEEAAEETTKEVAAEEVTENAEEAPAVEETVEEVKPVEETKASEFSEEIAEMVAPISSDPPALEPTAVTEVVGEAPAAATENKPARSKTFKLPFETKIFSKLFNKSEQKATPEPAAEAEPAVATETTEETAAENAEVEATTEAEAAAETEAPVESTEGETREVEAEPAVEEAPKAEAASEKPAQEKSHFFSRILSFNKSPKAAPAPVAVEPKVEEVAEETQAEAETEAQPEATEAPVEEAAPPAEEAVEPVPAEVAKDEAPASPSKDEAKRPFLARLLSGSRKNKTETPAAAEPTTEEVKVEEVTAEIPAEEVSAPVEEPVQETVEEAVTEAVSPDVLPLSVETVEEVTIAEESTPAPAPVADEIVPLADETAIEPTQEEAAAPSESQHSVAATEDSKSEEPKLPFLRRILSGGKKKTESAPETPVEPEAAVEEAPVVAEAAEAPVEEVAAPAETTEEPEATPAAEESVEAATEENVTATETATTEEAVPVPARQASLLSKIGGYAYSAVVPGAATIPEENEEDILEHYTELAKDAAFSGFLYKQSVLLHTNNHRFVILSKDGVFTYFRSAHVVSEGKKIAVNDNTTVQPSGDLLIVITSPSAAYHFQAKTTEDRDAWIAALANFAKKAEPVAEASEPAAEVETAEVAEVPEDVVVSQVDEDLTKATEEAEASK